MPHWKDLTVCAIAGVVAIVGPITGGSADNPQEIVWVRHQHRPRPALAKIVGDGKETRDRLSLLMYKVEDGGKSMRIISSRGGFSCDEELTSYKNDTPNPTDIYNELKRQVEKKAK